jgi:hypothetical protein
MVIPPSGADRYVPASFLGLAYVGPASVHTKPDLVVHMLLRICDQLQFILKG